MAFPDLDLLDKELVPVREAVLDLCSRFDDRYWRTCDSNRAYPEAFVDALIEGGWLSVLIPSEFGGGEQPLSVAATILEAINRSGGTAAPAHAQMYTMGIVLRHGNDEQKRRYLPSIASGDLRLQAFAITEADAGSDTAKIRTRAELQDDGTYRINGSKVFTSRYFHSDLMLLLARTTPYEAVEKKHHGLSVFLVDLREVGDSVKATPIATMVNHETVELAITDLIVPGENLIGEADKGFKYLLSGLNAERILVCSESIGSGYWFVSKAVEYASTREVFGRKIGSNQGIQFPLAQAYADLSAASAMRWSAVRAFDAGLQPGFEANTAKLLASKANWAAANAAMDTFGGYGMTEEYGIERKFREARLSQVAPISNNLALAFIAHNALGMPRSY